VVPVAGCECVNDAACDQDSDERYQGPSRSLIARIIVRVSVRVRIVHGHSASPFFSKNKEKTKGTVPRIACAKVATPSDLALELSLLARLSPPLLIASVAFALLAADVALVARGAMRVRGMGSLLLRNPIAATVQ